MIGAGRAGVAGVRQMWLRAMLEKLPALLVAERLPACSTSVIKTLWLALRTSS